MIEEKTTEDNLQQLVDLISAPLIAAAEANANMSKAQTDFLLECCFTKSGDGYAPKMIKMELSRKVISPENPGEANDTPKMIDVTTSFDLPLLTIVPLSSLCVNHIDVKFEVDVRRLASDLEGRPQMLGKIIQETNQEGLKIDIAINAVQVPLPQGVLMVIDAFAKNVQPINQ